MIKIKNNFDLKSTITCGQIFRYEVIEDEFIIVIKDRVISLKEEGKFIIVKSNNEDNLISVIEDYFDLNRDYDILCSDIIKMDEKLTDAVKYSKGLKIIHQDPFETIISYIISQNNRVPSIANALNLIAKCYGKKVKFNGREYYLFPEYKKLSKLSIQDYRECKVGFRDKYLYDVVNKINNNEFNINDIYQMNSEEALKYLISFKGIGMKVASCILLFAYQKYDVFPVDTWVKKHMKDNYNIEGETKIREFALNKYKEYSGIAIQYMFNYKRNGKIL